MVYVRQDVLAASRTLHARRVLVQHDDLAAGRYDDMMHSPRPVLVRYCMRSHWLGVLRGVRSSLLRHSNSGRRGLLVGGRCHWMLILWAASWNRSRSRSSGSWWLALHQRGEGCVIYRLSSGGLASAWLSAYAKPGQVIAACWEDPPFFSSETAPMVALLSSRHRLRNKQ